MHEQASLRSLGIERDSLILDGQPAPVLKEGSCISMPSMPYCDNVHTMATDPVTCQSGCDEICNRLSSMGFSLHEETEAATVVQTLGGIINGDLGHVRATPSRMWKIIFGFECLLEAKVSPT